ncbi:Protein EDS1B [Cardamine amara subsp. amara]|uniref:Protein EDS1B n=1 Tax=Cardamine amara subsp. amara TaxID=228776 RepID=A0ABD0ZFN8_CARAN
MAFQALPGFNGVLITGSLTASQSANQQDQNYSIEVQGEVVFFAFRPYFSTNNFFAPANGSPFGEIKMNRNQFPCMRSIGNNEDATVNEAFLKNLEDIIIDPRTSFDASVKMAVDSKKKIVFTGHSSGGATAILATVWYLEKYFIRNPIDALEPRCVTFGAPLVGDSIFNHALGRENWSRFFLNFVTRFDIVPRIMLARKTSIEQNLPYVLGLLGGSSQERDLRITEFFTTVMRDTYTGASQAVCQLTAHGDAFLETLSSFLEISPYRPVGTFVFSTEERLVAVNNSDAILQILFYTCQSNNDQECSQIPFLSISDHHSYGQLVQSMGGMTINHVDLHHGGNSLVTAFNDLGLSSRAIQCVRAALEAEKQRYKNEEEAKSKRDKILKKLAWIEDEYKPKCKAHKNGYYDSFKRSNEEKDFQANVTRAELAGVFDEVLGLVKQGQLPDGFEGDKGWIDLANRYRRLVEPLDISNYHRHLKNEDTGPYMVKGRPNRYIYAHRGYEHDKLKATGMTAEDAFWSKVYALNLGSQQEVQEMLKISGSKCGSCFWAEVEELRGKPYEKVGVRVKTLEALIDGWIAEGELDQEIFLQDSTFMKWWNTFPDNHKINSPVQKYITE